MAMKKITAKERKIIVINLIRASTHLASTAKMLLEGEQDEKISAFNEFDLESITEIFNMVEGKEHVKEVIW